MEVCRDYCNKRTLQISNLVVYEPNLKNNRFGYIFCNTKVVCIYEHFYLPAVLSIVNDFPLIVPVFQPVMRICAFILHLSFPSSPSLHSTASKESSVNLLYSIPFYNLTTLTFAASWKFVSSSTHVSSALISSALQLRLTKTVVISILTIGIGLQMQLPRVRVRARVPQELTVNKMSHSLHPVA